MFKRIPNYIKYLFSNTLFLFLYISIFRIIFYYFFSGIENQPTHEVSKAFSLGIRFDIKLAVISFLPLAILIFIVNYRFFSKPFFKKLSVFYIILTYITITLFHIFDFGYYDYLNIRLDSSSLRFLSNIGISTQVLFESYPVYKGIFAFIILIFFLYKFSSWIYNIFNTSEEHVSKKKKAFFIVVPFLLFALGIYNSFTHYPLRWSEAFFSKNNAVNQFALNPVLYFFDSFKFRNEGFDLEKTKKYYPAIAKELQLPKDSISFKRIYHKNDSLKYSPNIVIVMLESLGTVPMSYYGNPLNSTPKMDSIIKKSINFSNFYVHKAGTAASVFASITGLPDVDGIRTASRNPRVIDQRIIFDQFSGYEKLYFLGGSANWANIRGIFQSNIQNLKIFEEGSFEEENRADVWGIDDYDLFKEANTELEKLHINKKPFIAYIQTATNHMPFTVPENKESYQPLTKDTFSKEYLKKAGFDGIDRLNALRYLDFNVARFLKRAQESGYYDNTIFLFFGDHNTSMSYVDQYSKLFNLNLNVHNVPFFIHAPKLAQPKEIKKFSNLIDVIPTAAGLANINYTNYTLGTDALAKNTSDYAFLYSKIKGEPALTILKDSLLFTKTVSNNYSHLYNMNAKEYTTDIKKNYPTLHQKLDSLLNAVYHSTKYLYYNNKK
ncbi:phosphoglycerol transferase MdoB-like AlkP superfamily enzyme [Tenacibaculum lutimaris]|uniref:Phosphoglycerol transferase MdoB-like AlkP superfamily enzyme n=1 Tax=Tenacibaculum lutimaris TaxID=285258 RepID=A0A420DYX0_9FLAO|nr:LTA synthase family protein [Tenacibaculum lutimaris]RKF03005.1 phosphoglycerol transferase MdoB-like AlkP superfamily enzyme [Tenacibaculum lutimaris]